MRLGAKYRVTTGSPTVYECTYVSEHLAVLKAPGGGEFAATHCTWYAYEEVIEPRREFFNADKDGITGGTNYHGPYENRKEADYDAQYTRYGVLELIHHSETKVESVFHMIETKTIPTKSY